jgi:hypothetical protein
VLLEKVRDVGDRRRTDATMRQRMNAFERASSSSANRHAARVGDGDDGVDPKRLRHRATIRGGKRSENRTESDLARRPRKHLNAGGEQQPAPQAERQRPRIPRGWQSVQAFQHKRTETRWKETFPQHTQK